MKITLKTKKQLLQDGARAEGSSLVIGKETIHGEMFDVLGRTFQARVTSFSGFGKTVYQIENEKPFLISDQCVAEVHDGPPELYDQVFEKFQEVRDLIEGQDIDFSLVFTVGKEAELEGKKGVEQSNLVSGKPNILLHLLCNVFLDLDKKHPGSITRVIRALLK